MCSIVHPTRAIKSFWVIPKCCKWVATQHQWQKQFRGRMDVAKILMMNQNHQLVHCLFKVWGTVWGLGSRISFISGSGPSFSLDPHHYFRCSRWSRCWYTLLSTVSACIRAQPKTKKPRRTCVKLALIAINSQNWPSFVQDHFAGRHVQLHSMNPAESKE